MDWLIKKDNANYYGSNSANSCPNRIGSPHGQLLAGFVKQYHADAQANKKSQ